MQLRHVGCNHRATTYLVLGLLIGSGAGAHSQTPPSQPSQPSQVLAVPLADKDGNPDSMVRGIRLRDLLEEAKLVAKEEGPIALISAKDLRTGPRHVRWLKVVEVHQVVLSYFCERKRQIETLLRGKATILRWQA